MKIKTTLSMLFLILFSTTSHAYYQAEQGRWLNRDPIGENGGVNLYAMVDNNPFDNIDILGLANDSYKCKVVIGISHIGKVDNFANSLKGTPMCKYGGVGCFTSVQGEGGAAIGHDFPNPEGFIGWPKKGSNYDSYDPPLNAGYSSMEEMIDAMIDSGKEAAKELAADCMCECSDIKVEVKCQSPSDGYTKKLNKNPNCNKVVHTEPCAKNAKK